MKSEKWQKIISARELLQLGERATGKEIKAAYRRLSKKHHPDLDREQDGGDVTSMQEINAAYKVLLDYCDNFSFPLTPDDKEAQPLDGDDWWMDRFGQDPLWSKKSED